MRAKQAEELAHNHSLPPEAFEWYGVSANASKVGNNDEHLIQPV